MPKSTKLIKLLNIKSFYFLKGLISINISIVESFYELPCF